MMRRYQSRARAAAVLPSSSPQATTALVQIPHQSLNPTTLRAIIEEFVTREGTEYGEHEVSLEAKVDAVMAQLKRGDVGVFYDADSESVTLSPIDRRR